EEEIRGAARVQLLDVRDGSRAVGWIVAGVDAALVLREMPHRVPVEPRERVVALARDEHHRSGWHVQTDSVVDAIDELRVALERQRNGCASDRTKPFADCSSPIDRYERCRCSPKRP